MPASLSLCFVACMVIRILPARFYPVCIEHTQLVWMVKVHIWKKSSGKTPSHVNLHRIDWYICKIVSKRPMVFTCILIVSYSFLYPPAIFSSCHGLLRWVLDFLYYLHHLVTLTILDHVVCENSSSSPVNKTNHISQSLNTNPRLPLGALVEYYYYLFLSFYFSKNQHH